MHHRVTVARNLLKAWLLFLIPAGLLGFVGWRLGDYRLALLFAGSVFLLAAVVYWYSDRIAMGMVGARELLPAEAPALATRGEHAVGAGPGDPAEALPDPGRLSAGALRRPRGARRRCACRLDRAARASRRRRSSRGSSRTRSRTSGAATC